MEKAKEYIPEKILKDHQKFLSIEIMKIVFNYAENKICKIFCNDGRIETGFFCIIPLDNLNNNLRVLMTNNHIIGENELNSDIKIKLH